MKKLNKRLLVSLLGMSAIGLTFILAFSGCSTTIPVTYTEPAKVDMSGVKKIGIDSDDAQVASYISQQLSNTDKYTVAQAAELQAWKQWRAERQLMEALKEKQATATETSSADLAGEYKANAVRADSSYAGKLLRTSGVVKEIGKSSRGRYFARLDAGSDSVDVYFASSELSRLASVDKDQTITIVGECQGFNLPDMEDTAEILRILGAGRSVNIIDATFPVGELPDYPGEVDAVILLDKDLAAQDTSKTEERPATDGNGNSLKSADGKTIYRNVTVYERSVTVKISYQILHTRDGSSIGQGTKSATSSKSSNEDRSKLASPSELEAKIINTPLKELAGEMVPSERKISLTLAKNDATDKTAKTQMSEANKLVKAKDYKAAVAAYGKIYAQYGNFAAGYNQALLTEATEGTEAALTLMSAVAQKFNKPEAQNVLAGMRQRNAANQKAAEQLSE
jgi:mono/diheme cytochrome c family protein